VDVHSPVSTNTRLWRLLSLVLLTVVTLAALLLRCVPLDRSLWVDELHTAWTVSDGLDEVAGRAWAGNQGPLYFFLLWVWTSVVGLSETTLRLPSALAGAALAPLTYWLVLRTTSSQIAALLAAVMAALNPLNLEFSQEARPYAWVQCFALVHVFLFAELLRSPVRQETKEKENDSLRTAGAGPRWGLRVAWIGCGALLFHLHYTAALLFPAEVLAYLLLRLFRRKLAYGWIPFGADITLTALCCTPASWHLWQIAERRANWAMFVPRGVYVWDTPLWFPLAHAVFWPAVLLAASVVFRRVRGLRPIVRPVAVSILGLTACWMIAPAAIAWVLNETDTARLFLLRYLVVSVPAPAVMAGLFCGMSVGRVTRLLQSAVLAAMALVASGVTPEGLSRGEVLALSPNENWRGAVHYILDRQQSDASPVFVYSNLIEADRFPPEDDALWRYCLSPVTGLYRLDQPGRPLVPLSLDGRPALSAGATSRLSAAREAWVLVRGYEGQRDLARNGVAGTLAELGVSLEELHVSQKSFGDVTVLHFTWEGGT
jgi:mannosyltransferase